MSLTTTKKQDRKETIKVLINKWVIKNSSKQLLPPANKIPGKPVMEKDYKVG
jgi:hypothetical protein